VEFLPESGRDGRRAGETMSKRPCRIPRTGLEAKVVLAAVKGENRLAELAQQFDIQPPAAVPSSCARRNLQLPPPNQITQWKA